ncbi:Uncharacterised protein [Klebsiella pneumoniae]|nr:Uncharacterised protein [Klebsiella pneumoniae]
MLRRNNKIQLTVEKIINHAILAELHGLGGHAIVFIAQADELVENYCRIGVVDADNNVTRAARGIVYFVIDGR